MTTTKRQLAVFFMACSASFSAGIATHSSKFWRAYQAREELDYPIVAPYANIVGGEVFLKSERWKNEQKNALAYPEVRNLVSVIITRTPDTGDLTMSLFDVDGITCTLWLKGSQEQKLLRIHSITSY